MKIVCNTAYLNTLTKDHVYNVIKGSWEESRFFIRDNFENEQWYFCDYFYTLEELREKKIQFLLRDSKLEDLGI